MEIIGVVWILLQLIIGYNLVFPIILYGVSLFVKRRKTYINDQPNFDYAIIVTAYQEVSNLPYVVESILKVNYSNYLIYIVADNCDTSTLRIDDSRVIIIRPESVLSSNTKSHKYAIDRLVRKHDKVTIIDSDNLIDPQYLHELNKFFHEGFKAVQGVRKAKNTNTDIAALDAARDMYYHYYDGRLLFDVGSSATLAGSGMAFDLDLYRQFLDSHNVEGAGFDKVLQAWIVEQGIRIAFSEYAIVYDEKTSKKDQLISQRGRWIATWFKYMKLGFKILWVGITRFNINQFFFGMVLLRPPLFIFLFLSLLLLVINIVYSVNAAILWSIALLIFVLGFLVALLQNKAEAQIYRSLYRIPKFMFYQVISLLRSRKSKSVATKHYYDRSVDDLN